MSEVKLEWVRKAERLKYGQTPFDKLPKKQLLRLVCMYHSALVSTASNLRMSRVGQEAHPYWDSIRGSGGRSIAKAEYLERLAGGASDVGREKIYRCFYRSADQVLFPGLNERRGPWYICETCKQMASRMEDGAPSRFCKCSGAWRPFTLADIRPDLVCNLDGEQ